MAAMLKLYRRPRPDDQDGQRREQEEVQRLLTRFQYLLGVQRWFAVEWQEIADYVMPRKNSIIVQRMPGSKRTQRLYDSTAIDARDKFASAIHGGLTSGYVRWFYLGLHQSNDNELLNDQLTQIWCDQVGELLLDDFNHSNFSSEAGELYQDVTTFASALMSCEEIPPPSPREFGGLLFRTEQPGRYAWSEAADGTVNTVFLERFMSAQAIREKWPDTPPEALKSDAQKPDELLSVLHCTVPDPDGKNWTSTYIMTNSKWRLSQKRFNEFPFFGVRWSKSSGETYGRGITHDALPDIRSLNKLKEMGLRALPKIVDPTMKVLAGDMVGPSRLVPGGLITLRSSVENLQPLQSGIDLRQSGMSATELKQSIQSIYHLTEIQFQEGPQMTATEVAARREQMLQLLGPVLYGRMQYEFLQPLIRRAFNIRRRAGALPPIPPKMQMALQARKLRLKISYDGPVARAQRASDIDSVTKLVSQVITPLAPIAPDALDAIDFDEMIRVSGRKLGVPPTIIRDKDQTGQVRVQKQQAQQAAQEQAQQAQAAQMAGQVAPAMKAAGKAPEPGSPLHQIMNNQPQPGQNAGQSQ